MTPVDMANNPKRSPYLSQMASSALSARPSPLESSDRSSSDFFELRRPDGNVINLSLRSSDQLLSGTMPRSSYSGPVPSQPRRSSGNLLDLSARSDSFVPTRMKRRSSERIYVNNHFMDGQPRIPAAQRSSSRPTVTNFNINTLDNLPESSAVLSFNRRPDNALSQVNNAHPQNSSFNKGANNFGRPTQVKSGPFQCILNDQSGELSFRKTGHNNSSFNRENNNIIRPRRSRSHDDLTDAAIQQPRRQSEVSHFANSPEGFLLEIQEPMISLSDRTPSPHRARERRQTSQTQVREISSQMEYMKMLKQKEQSLFEKPSNGVNSFSPTISTYESSTDTNNRRLMLGEVQVTPSKKKVQSNRSMKDSNRLLVEFANKSEEKSGESPWCCTHKKVVIIGLFLLLLGLGLGGYFYFFYGAETKDDSGNEQASSISDESVAENTTKVDIVITMRNKTAITPPPSDIEARCSASNLPGSLSACLSACLPSACCYPGFTGETCLDNAGCSPYRPYCDVFYNAWTEATEGVLRDVTNDMMDMCSVTMANGNHEMQNSTATSDTEEIFSSIDELSKLSPRKRLRGHHSQENVTDTTDSSSSQQTCQQYCIAAKCCDAPVIGDPMLSGLVLSPFGVYTDAVSGEHVMTNCQMSNNKNVHICARYRELCSSSEVVESSPEPVVANESGNLPVTTAPFATPSPVVLVPAKNETASAENSSVITVVSTTTMSPTSSPSQLEGPSSTSHPTYLTRSPVSSPIVNEPVIHVPSANIESIQLSCASDKAKFLIRTGDASARAECIRACLEGLCCFTDDLGYTLTNSCYEGNEHKCTQYASCLILKDSTLYENEDVTESIERNVTVSMDTNATIVNVNETILNINETSLIHNNTLNFVASNARNNTNNTTIDGLNQ